MGKRWTTTEDAIIASNFWNMRAAEIAKLLLGRTTGAIQHRAKALGLRKSPQEQGRIESAVWDKAFSKRLGEPICTWLRRRYVDEHATYRKITAEVGINTRSLMRLMKQCNIEPISPQEAVRRQIEANPDFLKPMQRAARSQKARNACAKTRQETWETFCSANELRFLATLRAAGLAPTPQLAVESFNIDFAFPETMLAVELDPRWHRSPRKRPMDRKKDKRLDELGWTVLRLDDRTSDATNIRKVSDALTALAETQPR